MICHHDFQCEGWTCDQYGKCRECGVGFVFFTDLCDPDNFNVKAGENLQHNLSQYNDIPATKT